MTGKIRTLELAEGLSFGRDGRYAVLEVLGRGWEGEVYAVADTTIEGAPNVKVAKFTSVISDDFSVAPSWGKKTYRQRKKILSNLTFLRIYYGTNSLTNKKNGLKPLKTFEKMQISLKKPQ